MKKAITLMFLHSSMAVAIQAQNNHFQIGIGYQQTFMIDNQASPLKYVSAEKTISLGYVHTGNKGRFKAEINGALGDFFPAGFKNRQLYDPGYNSDGTEKTDSFQIEGKLYNARVKVGYLKQIGNSSSVIGTEKQYINNYVGASLNNQLFYSENFVRAGWLNSSTINAEYEHIAIYQVKHSFNIKLSIPLFGRNTRLPYHNTISSPEGYSGIKTIFKQGSSFSWLGNFQNIQLDAGYQYAAGKHVALGIHYFGQWLHYNKEIPITLFQNNIGVTASLK